MRVLATPILRHRFAGLVCLGSMLLSPTGCDDAEEAVPFPGCSAEERTPAFCSGDPAERCACNQCDVTSGICTRALFLEPATCRADGSDFATCGCTSGPPRAECSDACATMRCAEGCDAQSVLACEQRCQDFFVQHEELHGPAGEGCAVAIATVALCMAEDGSCPAAPPCVGLQDWRTLRFQYEVACGSE